MDINQKIAERIKQLRKEKNLTAEKLAWYSELSKSCVTYAEKAQRDIKMSTIESICKGFGITIADFFSSFK
ncbi:MAG: helix-turn-helix transcriptional regulator [Cyanobacteria bacterium SIG32]|nr:helix-turn-helix transcriptional regulator [Cyanobacteria bacterium SIG32]